MSVSGRGGLQKPPITFKKSILTNNEEENYQIAKLFPLKKITTL